MYVFLTLLYITENVCFKIKFVNWEKFIRQRLNFNYLFHANVFTSWTSDRKPNFISQLNAAVIKNYCLYIDEAFTMIILK